MKKTLNTNITTEERANMTAQQINLRIESGENIDPREEVVVVDATIDSIFAEEDRARATGFGEHRVHLNQYHLEKSVQIIKNGVITETKPYVLLTFCEEGTSNFITKRLYAGMVEGLRRNINREYAGIAAPMTTRQMLDWLRDTCNPISIWTRWDNQYGKIEVDFFDREAWEAYKAEQARIGADTRKSSGTNRATEKRAIR